METLDAGTQQQLGKLVEALTDPAHGTLPPAELKALKALLKRSDSYVIAAHAVLMERLADSHAQTRLLALEVMFVIFARSKAFRAAVASNFQNVLELSVGHKASNPLPGPGPAAASLRQRALEVVEAWHEQFGRFYPQVTLGYRYLKDGLKLRFPQIQHTEARTAEQQQLRAAQTQQLLRARYGQIVAELGAQRPQLELLLHQLRQCFALLQESSSAAAQAAAVQAQATVGGAAAGGAAAATLTAQQGNVPLQQYTRAALPTMAAVAGGGAAEDEDWEDVQLPAAEGPNAADQQNHLGISIVDGSAADADGAADDLSYLFDDLVDEEEVAQAYTADEEPAAADQRLDPEQEAQHAALLEQLQDLCKQAAGSTARQLQDWLRVLTAVQFEEGAQARERQALLREVVGFKGQFQDALLTAQTHGVHVQLGTQQSSATLAAIGASGASHAGLAPGSDAEAAGSSGANAHASHSDLVAHPNLGTLPSQAAATSPNRQQVQAPAHGSGRLLQHQHGQQHASQHRGDPDLSFDVLLRRGSGSQASSSGREQGGQGARAQQQRQRPQQQGAAVPAEPVSNPYEKLVDPAAPQKAGPYIIPRSIRDGLTGIRAPDTKQKEQFPLQQQQQQEAPSVGTIAMGTMPVTQSAGLAPAPAPANRLGVTSTSALSADVKQKLLAAAPVVPASEQLEYWLSASSNMLVNQSGLEVSNHWGPVDNTAQVPSHRLDELFGYSASYYVPSTKPAAAAAASQAPSAVAVLNSTPSTANVPAAASTANVPAAASTASVFAAAAGPQVSAPAKPAAPSVTRIGKPGAQRLMSEQLRQLKAQQAASAAASSAAQAAAAPAAAAGIADVQQQEAVGPTSATVPSTAPASLRGNGGNDVQQTVGLDGHEQPPALAPARSSAPPMELLGDTAQLPGSHSRAAEHSVEAGAGPSSRQADSAEAPEPSTVAAGARPAVQRRQKRPRDESAAHNARVLAAMSGDAIAAALQEQLLKDAAQEAVSGGRSGGRKATESAAAKWRKKLLS